MRSEKRGGAVEDRQSRSRGEGKEKRKGKSSPRVSNDDSSQSHELTLSSREIGSLVLYTKERRD